MSAGTGESGGEVSEKEMGTPVSGMPMQPSEEMPAVQAAETSIAPAPPKVGGRRTQLKVVRERIQSLSKEVGDFRKSHEVSTKKLEADMASLRKDVTNIRSKDLGHHLKGHAAETERLEKQIKALRNELGSMKAKMAKETSRSKAREKALISRIVAKARTAKPSKPRAKQTKRRR